MFYIGQNPVTDQSSEDGGGGLASGSSKLVSTRYYSIFQGPDIREACAQCRRDHKGPGGGS